MRTQTARSGVPTPEAGTTMVGLLGLLVILGVLAAGMVAALNLSVSSTTPGLKPGELVPGPASQGHVPLPAVVAAAVASDTESIRTAESAYFAMSGAYGGEADLVRDGFLAQASRYHDVVVADGGRSYTIVCAPDQPCDHPGP